ncbi:metallophosphoesterase family protein [Apilactobacillus micheneri]|uniref:metallophosphoesterase family protein n=1 Tax=Apilactobacillus micheneri TaxID=1899430 RepID=UPI000D592DFA|nr:metallophosphoesterase family protein [Apilactobacillus micheneri]
MQYFISDTHFFDKHMLGIDDFAPRPFFFVNDMNNKIIDNWNSKVQINDTVYHLGDIAVHHIKPAKKAYEAIFNILKKLHGNLILIKGNHDSRDLFKFLSNHNYYINGKLKFEFHDVGVLIKMNHCQYYMTHYPMMMGKVEKIINLHGHIHHYSVPIKDDLNVGVDSPELDYLKSKPSFGAPLSESEVQDMVLGKSIDFAKRH